MANHSFPKWFNDVSIAKKLYALISIIAVIIAVEAGVLYFAVSTLSSIRAFVTAEGLWSRAQKNAVLSLRNYSKTQSKEDKQAFDDFMRVPLGHHKTLVELKKINLT